MHSPRPDDMQRNVGSLPLSMGGLGLRSATRGRFAAYWASWADSLSAIQSRHPILAEELIAALDNPRGAFYLQGAAECREMLLDRGFDAPRWGAVAHGSRPGRGLDDAEPAEAAHGWQRPASSASEECFRRGAVWPRLSGDRALLRSQSGPLSGVPFISSPAFHHSRFSSQEFRVLLLRRLWLSLPLTSRVCRCGRPLDSCGHHRAACSRAGVLGNRGYALESAAARVCREAGGRVSTNVFLRDMALDPCRQMAEGSRLSWTASSEVRNSPIDTTLVSPLRGDGQPHRRCVDRRREERTYPELCERHSRARLVVLAAEVGSRWSDESADFLKQLAKAKARGVPRVLQVRTRQAWQMRWSSLLACSSALDKRAVVGVDGDTPSSSDVVGDIHHVPLSGFA